jgi:hypothetical protein
MRTLVVVVLLISSVSCQSMKTSPAAATTSPPPTERERYLEMFARGYFPGRAGQIFVVPEKGDFFLSRPDDFYRFMHGSPWDYDVEIPLVLYGEPFIRSGAFTERATQQDVAPTLATLLGLSPPASMSGRVLASALTRSREKPGVVVLAVFDGFSRSSVEGLPTLSRLRSAGAWFENMEVSYLPSVTSAGHATVATGTDPRFHGINANATYDRRTGKSDGPFPQLNPAGYMVLTLADHWNLASRGRAVIVTQGTTARAAVALAGYGGCAANARRFVMAMYDDRENGWVTNPECYRLPDYLKGHKAPLGETWLGHKVDSGRTLLRTGLFPRFQMDALVEMIEKDSVGRDGVTDLLVVSFKTPDYVSHQYGPNSAEMKAALAALDEELSRLLKVLDERAGSNRYVLAITADHGMPPEPDGTRTQRRYVEDIVDTVHDRFDPAGRGLILDFSDPANHQMFVDEDRLEELHLTMRQLADFVEGLPFVNAAFTEEEVRAARVTSSATR